MKITKENLDNYEVELTIEVDAAERDKAKKTAAKEISVPGFRKGKAPVEVVERQPGGKETLMDEAANLLIRKAEPEALKQENLTPYTYIRPEIVTNEDGKNFVFKMRFTPYPEVKLGQYKDIEVPRTVEPVTDEDIDKHFEILRDRDAVMTDADPDDTVIDGDMIMLDYEGSINGKKFAGGEAKSQPLTIGSKRFIPGFEDQLIGAKAGEERDVKVTFPEEYHSKEVAGKDAVFKCKVISIKHRQLPELNDDFAKKYKFTSIEDMRKSIRQNMAMSAERAATEKQQETLLNMIVDNITVDVPQVIIDNQINQMINERAMQLQSQGLDFKQYLEMSGYDLDELREQYRESAERNVKVSLMLEEVADAENIKITSKDYEYELMILALTSGIGLAELKKIVKKEHQEASIRANARQRKIVDFLVKNNKLEQPAPAEALEDVAKVNAVDAEAITADDVKADDDKVDDAKADDVKADDDKADDDKADDVKATDDKVDDAEADDVKATDDKVDDAKADDVKATDDKDAAPTKEDAKE